MSSSPLLSLMMAMICLMTLVSCSRRSEPQMFVFGEITMNDEPVEAAQVYLTASCSGLQGKGGPATISAMVVDGMFEISDALAPGEYEIRIQPVEPDAELAFEQIRLRNPHLLKDRNRLLNAVRHKGPIHLELLAGEVNEVTIELTTR